MWQWFLFFEWSISFAYSHPFVCFVYKSAVVEERQSSYLRLTSSDYGTARKILGGMPWNTSRLYCQGLFFVCRADNGWLLLPQLAVPFLSHNPNDMKQWHATLSCLSSTAGGKVFLFVGCRLTDQNKHHSLICRTILFAYSTARKKSLL